MRTKPIANRAILSWIIIFCLTQLAACSFNRHKYSSSSYDGAPTFNFDASKIPDAVPKKEAINRYNSKPYVVRGHRYVVLKSADGYSKYGVASWYGMKFHGHTTATNEAYNVVAMTAASTELPLPSYAQVTNMENGKQIIVRVNDRGPFACHRIMDLSYAAAKKLGFAGQGTAKVHVVGINPDLWNKNRNIYYAHNTTQPAKNSHETSVKISPMLAANKVTENKTTISKQKFYLQIGAFTNLSSAQKISQKITSLVSEETHIDKTAKNSAPLYRVQIGPLFNKEEGERVKKLLAINGLGRAIAKHAG